jgi:hypothetical protein
VHVALGTKTKQTFKGIICSIIISIIIIAIVVRIYHPPEASSTFGTSIVRHFLPQHDSVCFVFRINVGNFSSSDSVPPSSGSFLVADRAALLLL